MGRFDYPLGDARPAKQRENIAGIRRGLSVLMLAYSAALTVGLTLSAPWWLTRMLTTDRYREGLGERLGRVPRRLCAAVSGRRVVWLHAVSVGEVLAASRLVEELGTALRTALDEDWIVVVSTTTRTGQALARERFGADRVFYFPLDFAWAVRAYLRALHPSLLVLMESELWPRMLHECGRAGVPVAVANARVSDRSYRRAMRFPRTWVRFFGEIDLFLAQSQGDAERLAVLGGAAQVVQVSGNLKYDVRAQGRSLLRDWIREVAAGRPVFVAGSTTGEHAAEEGDEEPIVMAAWWSTVRAGLPSLLVLAPRHPERFGATERRLAGFAYVKASAWRAAGETSGDTSQPGPLPEPSCFIPGHKGRPDIILLDTIGDLAAVYAVADVAFVGGSLVQRGGHNPLEPAQFGVPVLMGPSCENFRDVVAKLRVDGGLCVIEDKEELEAAILRLLKDPEAARAEGERGRKVFEAEGGATARTITALLALLKEKGAGLPVETAGMKRETP